MITVAGSLNLDLFVDAPRLPRPGETVLGHGFRQTPGGKGANQACAIGRLGHPVTLLGAVGTDAFGDQIAANLAAFHVDGSALLRRPNDASGIAFIIVDSEGQNQIVVAPGANASLSPSDIDAQFPLFKRSQAVVVQLEIPLPAAEAALRSGRRAGAITMLNPAPIPNPATPITDELLGLCDWIVPNEHEAAALAGLPAVDLRNAPAAIAAIRRRSPRCGIVLTLGAEGAWLDPGPQFPPTTAQHIAPFPVTAVDTVGAGDSFVGAFAVRLVEGAPPAEAARFAAAAAALAVTRPGAQAGLPTRDEVEQLLAR